MLVKADFSCIQNALLKYVEFINKKEEDDFTNKELAQEVFLAYFDVGKDLMPNNHIDVSELEESVAYVAKDLDNYVFQFGNNFQINLFSLILDIRSGIQFFIKWHSVEYIDKMSVEIVDETLRLWQKNPYGNDYWPIGGEFDDIVRPRGVSDDHWWWDRFIFT
jgi:hypothetical protein